MLPLNKNVVWLSVWAIMFSISYFSKIQAQEINQDHLKKALDQNKFLLFKGYVLEEDTLIARTPQAEKQVAKFYAQLEECLDKVELLNKQNDLRWEEAKLLRNIIKRKDYAIEQQDSLLTQLEKIAKPPHPFVQFLKKIFKPEVTLILRFMAGVMRGLG